MHCNDYLQLLSGHLDHTNSEKEEKRLQGHLKNCRHCRELLAQMEANDVLLNDEAIVPPADLTDRIMAQVKKEPRKRFNYRRFVPYAAAGLATAAMLTVVLTGRFSLPTDEKVSAELPNPLESIDSRYFEADDYALRQEDADDFGGTACPNDANGCTEATPDDRTPADIIYNDALGDETYNCVFSDVTEAAAPPTEAPTQATEAPAPSEQQTEAAPSTEAAPTEPTHTTAPIEVPDTTLDGVSEPTIPEVTQPTIADAGDPVFLDPANTKGPFKRGPLHEKLDVFPDGPVLVFWDAADVSLSSYENVETVELRNLSVPTDTALLFPRFMQALPLIEKSTPNSALITTENEFTVTAYRTSYTTFNSVLLSFIGKHEAAVYYPTTEGDYTQGLVLLVANTSE